MRFWFLLLLSAAVVRGQIIVNGSFEGPASSATFGITGAFTLQGWSGVAPSNGGNAGLVVGVDNGLAPADGGQHFTFNGGNPSDRGYIQQTFATSPGATYQVTFSVGRAGGGQALALTADVSSGGAILSSGTFSPPATRSYSSVSLSFLATGPSATLRFTDVSGGNSISDLYLDNVGVSVSAIPEPSTYAAIFGLGALAVAAYTRSARRGLS